MDSQLLKDIKDSVQTLDQNMQHVMGLIAALRKDSVMTEQIKNTDPQSYYECWGFLENEVEDLYRAVRELKKSQSQVALFKEFIAEIETSVGLGFSVDIKKEFHDQIMVTVRKDVDDHIHQHSSVVPFNHLNKLTEIIQFGRGQIKVKQD